MEPLRGPSVVLSICYRKQENCLILVADDNQNGQKCSPNGSIDKVVFFATQVDGLSASGFCLVLTISWYGLP